MLTFTELLSPALDFLLDFFDREVVFPRFFFFLPLAEGGGAQRGTGVNNSYKVKSEVPAPEIHPLS